MNKRFEVYRCDCCGSIAQVVTPGRGSLICCGQPMVHASLPVGKNIRRVAASQPLRLRLGVGRLAPGQGETQWVQIVCGSRSISICQSHKPDLVARPDRFLGM